MTKYPYSANSMNWINEELKMCQRCPRLVACRQAIYPGYGNYFSGVIFIGQNPGIVKEIITRVPFRGNKSGHFFQDALKKTSLYFGLVYSTNLVKCGPNDGKKNILPTKKEIANCQSYLIEELKLVKPLVIATLGSLARDNLPDIEEVRRAHVRHLQHPSYVLRFNKQEKFMADLIKIKKLLRKARKGEVIL